MAHIPSGEQPVPEVARAIEEINPVDQGYVADQVLRPIGQNDKEGKIRLIEREGMLRIEDRVAMSEGSTYPRVDYGTSLQAYSCTKYGAEAQITDEERANAASSFDAERQAGNRAVGSVLMKVEDIVSDLIFDTSTWSGSDLTTTVDTSWEDHEAAIPEDVMDAGEKVRENTGVKPNALICGKKALNYMLYNDAITGSFSDDSLITPAVVRQNVAALFDLDYLIVGDAVKNTANAGATSSNSDFWGSDYAMVAKVAETDDSTEPAIGRTVRWNGMDDTGYSVTLYREQQTDSDVLKVRRYLDHIVVDKYFGHLIDITK